MATLALEGKALAWYCYCMTSTPNPTWDVFLNDILGRFQPKMIENPFEANKDCLGVSGAIQLVF